MHQKVDGRMVNVAVVISPIVNSPIVTSLTVTRPILISVIVAGTILAGWFYTSPIGMINNNLSGTIWYNNK